MTDSMRISDNTPVVLPGLPTSLGAEFGFGNLSFEGIDNGPVFAAHGAGLRAEETCVFHRTVATGDAYVALLARRIEAAMKERTPLPVVRFADGEYAFYKASLKCNGLYQQAESASAIRASFPAHARALKELSETGFLAPLLFPGNMRRHGALASLFKKKEGNDGALCFLEFLASNGIRLTGANYIPFYAVYAYLSGPSFAAAVNGKKVCVVNSDFNAKASAKWFASAGSYPMLVHAPLPDSFVATRWASMRSSVLGAIPSDVDCVMAGAGVGALEVCVDAARELRIPAIDSGHIINAMNGLESKSKGPRLFTYRR
jgi:hypothetical protein